VPIEDVVAVFRRHDDPQPRRRGKAGREDDTPEWPRSDRVWSGAQLILRRWRGSGLPVPVAGRSLRPSWASLARCWLRSAIHGCARQQRRLPGTGSPSLLPE